MTHGALQDGNSYFEGPLVPPRLDVHAEHKTGLQIETEGLIATYGDNLGSVQASELPGVTPEVVIREADRFTAMSEMMVQNLLSSGVVEARPEEARQYIIDVLLATRKQRELAAQEALVAMQLSVQAYRQRLAEQSPDLLADFDKNFGTTPPPVVEDSVTTGQLEVMVNVVDTKPITSTKIFQTMGGLAVGGFGALRQLMAASR